MTIWRRELRIFLPSFGAHLPEVPSTLQEQNVYPLAVRTPTGFDLDLSPLLLVDQIILDSFAYSYISDPKRPHLAPMRATVDKLMEEGFLRFEDFGEIAKTHDAALRERVQRLLEVPEYWLSTARRHWIAYKAELPHLIRRYGSNADPDVEGLHFGVYCLLKNSGRVDYRESKRLHTLLEGKRQRFSVAERDVLGTLIRPILSHVLFMHLLRTELKCPFVDWLDLEPYYSRLHDPMWSDRTDRDTISLALLRQCQHLFSTVLPELRPMKVDEVVAFVRARGAVRSLRAELHASLEEGYPLDHTWAARLRDEANRAQLTARRRQRILSWIGLGLGGVPIAPVSDLAREAISQGMDIAEQAGGAILENRGLKRFEWYYALVGAKGA